MKKLTNKENEIMEFFWDEGALYVKDILAKYPEPRPHFNTLSTIVRILESNGYLSHTVFGNTYQYYPLITKEEYGKSVIRSVVSDFFQGSYLDAVSAFVKDERISINELSDLIDKVKNPN